MSIRFRIVVATLTLTLSGLSCTGFATYRLIESFLIHRLDEQITRQSGRLILQGSSQAGFVAPPTDALVPVADGAFFEMQNSQGQVVDKRTVEGSNSDPNLSSLPEGQEGTFTVDGTSGGSDFRVNVRINPSNGNSIIPAVPLTAIDATLSRRIWSNVAVPRSSCSSWAGLFME